MKSSLTKLASSLMGLLVATEKVSDADLSNRCDDIREVMLTLLDQCRRSTATEAVASRVCYARDIEALWYLRSAVMVQVTVTAGEAEAHAQLARITAMFKGYLPASLAPRSRNRGRTTR